MKKLCLVLALLLLLLSGCGKGAKSAVPFEAEKEQPPVSAAKPEPAPEPEPEPASVPDPEPAPKPDDPIDPSVLNIDYAGTYWRAYQYVSPTSKEDDLSLPTEQWSIDLLLYEDGTARLRDVVDNVYTSCLKKCDWSLKFEELTLSAENYGNDFKISGGMNADGALELTYYDGGKILLTQENWPGIGGEYCPADLTEKLWTLDEGEIEGWRWSAEEQGMKMTISFSYWGTVTVTEENYEKSEEYADLPYIITSEPLYYSCDNAQWEAEFTAGSRETGDYAEYYVTLIGENELEMIRYYYGSLPETEIPGALWGFFTGEPVD